MSQETRRRRGIDPIWWAPVLVLVVVVISTLTAMAFEGTLRTTVPLTVISDRAGLVMEDDAKVKLRGVQIGEVAKVESYADSAGTNLSKLKLKIYPNEFRFLPSNVEAEIKSSTAFGAKYVDLIVPAAGASHRRTGQRRCAAQPQHHRRGQHRLRELAVDSSRDRPGEAERCAVGVGRRVSAARASA